MNTNPNQSIDRSSGRGDLSLDNSDSKAGVQSLPSSPFTPTPLSKRSTSEHFRVTQIKNEEEATNKKIEDTISIFKKNLNSLIDSINKK